MPLGKETARAKHVFDVPRLYATQGLDLRGPLRRTASSDDLRTLIANRWRSRDDRGAEQRLALGGQRAFVPVQDLLKRDPHLEMHTRGG